MPAKKYNKKARRISPETAKKAGKGLVAATLLDVYRTIKKIGPATCEQVIFKLKEKLPVGKTLREDPISGTMSTLTLMGRIAPTGNTNKNTSGKDAILWRKATKEERSYIKSFTRNKHADPWPSPDFLLELPAVRQALGKHPDVKVRNAYKSYCRGRLWRKQLKDMGIKRFMAKYDTDGNLRNK